MLECVLSSIIVVLGKYRTYLEDVAKERLKDNFALEVKLPS